MDDDILKQLEELAALEYTGSSGYSGSFASGYSGSFASGYSVPNGYRQGYRQYTEQEMVDAFLAGYKALMLIDEEIKPEIIEMAKNHVENLCK